jgi:hypothetical protein
VSPPFALPHGPSSHGNGKGSTRIRAALTVVIVALYVLLPRTASAQKMTIVVFVDGPGAGAMREALVKAIPRGVDVADDKHFRAELARTGQRPIAALDAKAIGRLRRAGRAMGAEAVLVARVRRDKTGRVVRWLLVDAVADVAPSKSVRLGLAPRDADVDQLAAALGHSLDAYAPPEEPVAPEPEVQVVNVRPLVPVPAPVGFPGPAPLPVDRPAPPSPKTPAQLVATSLLDVSLGIEGAGRRFDYDNGISPSPYVYRLGPTPAVRVAGSVFPFSAHGGPWGDLGIAFDYSRVAVGKSDLDGAPKASVPTSHSLSLRARIHPGREPRVLLGVSLGYAFSFFGLVGPANAELPDVTYRAIRPSLDARVPFGSVSILGAVAFRAIIAPASISARLDGPGGYGFDGQLGAAFMFARHFEARVVARYERYSLDLPSPRGAAFRSGGAVDQWYGASASLALVF